MSLTKYQSRLLRFIISFTNKRGYTPSYREMMDKLGYNSTATVALHVDSLIDKGYLRKVPNAARSLEILPIDGGDITTRALRAAETATQEDLQLLAHALIMLGYYDTAKELTKHEGWERESGIADNSLVSLHQREHKSLSN